MLALGAAARALGEAVWTDVGEGEGAAVGVVVGVADGSLAGDGDGLLVASSSAIGDTSPVAGSQRKSV